MCGCMMKPRHRSLKLRRRTPEAVDEVKDAETVSLLLATGLRAKPAAHFNETSSF
jgi:hypothetical protein